MKVKDVLLALDRITGGRCVRGEADLGGGKNRFVVTKTSGITGKACTELPGLVYGNPEASAAKIAVVMTLTESVIELAQATGIDVIISHHPIADAASCGGVTLHNYLSLYGIAVFELHEAFHGLHPGIAYIHGHRVFRTEIAYGGIPGNVMMAGRALEGIDTLADMIGRIDLFSGYDEEAQMLSLERRLRKCPSIEETAVSARGKILLGNPEGRVCTILHIFPHTGFNARHLQSAKAEHPEADTVIASISRLPDGHEIIDAAAGLNLQLLIGNSHALEIMENGMPLAAAVQKLLPESRVFLFRERVTSTPIAMAWNEMARTYGDTMAEQFLVTQKCTPIQ